MDIAEELYWIYPRHLEKRSAVRAIEKALIRLAQGEAGCLMSKSDAVLFLRTKVEVFAKSPAAHKGEFTKYPATWFNKSCYLDDPSEWSDNGPKELTKGQQRVINNRQHILDALNDCKDAGLGRSNIPDRSDARSNPFLLGLLPDGEAGNY